MKVIIFFGFAFFAKVYAVQRNITNAGSSQDARHCTFNSGMCGYTMDGLWRRNRGSTASQLTGPSSDVDGNGVYVYTETSGARHRTTSHLQSPVFNATTGPQCFSLRYHMYGRHMGKLIAYVTGTVHTKKWEMAGDQGNVWKKAEFNVDSRVPFRITFVAISGLDYTSDSSLDNLFLHDKPCGTNSSRYVPSTAHPRWRTTVHPRYVRSTWHPRWGTTARPRYVPSTPYPWWRTSVRPRYVWSTAHPRWGTTGHPRHVHSTRYPRSGTTARPRYVPSTPYPWWSTTRRHTTARLTQRIYIDKIFAFFNKVYLQFGQFGGHRKK